MISIKPKDRDFIETIEGYLFCVVGYLHPENGYTAYLKYVPSETGKWERDGVRYSRSIPYYQVSQVENTYQFLKQMHPEYILDCPVRNIEVSWVPKNRMKKYYYPQERLSEIKKNGPNDSLEDKLLRLTTIFEEQAGIQGSLGVTGSILTKTHNPEFSDMDITVYGLEESYKLKKVLLELKAESNMIKGVTKQKKLEWIQSRMEKYRLKAKDLMKISDTRWNYGYFEDVYFSVHPTRTDSEIKESYRDNTYNRIGEITGIGIISEASESIFLPAVYKIESVECKLHEDISEIVSFEGLYGSLFNKGDKIEFNGILEEINGKDNHKRIIIGGAGSPYNYVKWV